MFNEKEIKMVKSEKLQAKKRQGVALVHEKVFRDLSSGLMKTKKEKKIITY